MVAANQRPDRSGLIRATRCVLAVQVVATVVAIVLAAPDFIDRLKGPSSCTDCMDVRGVAFIVLLILFTPVMLALMTAVLLLRPYRMWLSWLALAVNLALVGFIAYGVLVIITGQGGTPCSDMCVSFDYGHTPLLVQHIQVLLLAVPPLASLVLVGLQLAWPSIRPSRRTSTVPET